MKFFEKAFALTVFMAIMALVAGWFINIYQLVDSVDSPVTVETVVRVAGIFLAPLGSFMGLFG